MVSRGCVQNRSLVTPPQLLQKLPFLASTPRLPDPRGSLPPRRCSCPAAILMASPSPPQGALLLCVEARPPQVHKTSLSFPLLALTREGGTTCLLRLPSAPSARSPLGPGPVSLFSPPAGPLLPTSPLLFASGYSPPRSCPPPVSRPRCSLASRAVFRNTHRGPDGAFCHLPVAQSRKVGYW